MSEREPIDNPEHKDAKRVSVELTHDQINDLTLAIHNLRQSFQEQWDAYIKMTPAELDDKEKVGSDDIEHWESLPERIARLEEALKILDAKFDYRQTEGSLDRTYDGLI